MDSMHARSHHQLLKPVIPSSQPQRRMMKLSHQDQQCFMQKQCGHFDSQQNNHRQSTDCGRRDFTNVEAEGRGHVHVDVAVMDSVKSPEPRQNMIQQMPQPHPQVQQHDGGDGADRSGRQKPSQQSRLLCVRPVHNRDREAAQYDQYDDSVDPPQDQVTTGMTQSLLRGPAGTKRFDAPDRQQASNRSKHAELLKMLFVHSEFRFHHADTVTRSD